MALVNIKVKVPNWLDLICISPLLLYRLLSFGYPFRKIPLTQGYFAVVDPVVYYVLVKFKWRVCKNKRKKTLYAERSFLKSAGRYSRVLMHCQLMPDVPPGLLIDHANGDGLDNRLSNLRPATVAQNAWNARPRKSRAGYKGVAWAKDKNLWRGNICVHGKRIHLGYFRTSTAAAKAYDAAAKKYFGDFAKINFPKEIERSPKPRGIQRIPGTKVLGIPNGDSRGRLNLRLANWLGARLNFTP